MAVIRGIYRYPVKGLSGQSLPSVQVEAGQPFPFDRVFALARPGGRIDAANPHWAKKAFFLMLMLEEQLAEIRTELDPETLVLSITAHDGTPLLEASLADAPGRRDVETFVQHLVRTLPGPPKLVRSQGGHFMDKPENVVSLLNLATLRSLEARWGHSLDPLRFRANLVIDGAAPWEEFDWIGGTLHAGGAVFRADRRNGRCGATNVDPWTGKRDRNLPAALREAFGHKDLGIYLVTECRGEIRLGDSVTAAGAPQPAQPSAAARPARYVCQGCYYLYDGAAGPPGELPSSWQCPDCGTDSGKLQPYGR